MQVDDQDRSKRQKVTHGTGMELEGLVMEAEFDRLQRYADADSYLDKIVSKDCKEREAVRKDLLQLGVHSSVHVAEVFSDLGNWCFVHRLGPTLGLALDLRTGCDLNDPAQRAKVWSHLQRERSILIVGSWSVRGARTTHMRWMIDTYRWQVSQGRFFVNQHTGNSHPKAESCAMKAVLVSRVDCWRTFFTNCEEISKLNCRSHIAENCVLAMIHGLRQALTRLAVCRHLNLGRQWVNPVLQRWPVAITCITKM